MILASAVSEERAAEIEARGPRVARIPADERGMRVAVERLYREHGVGLLLVEGGPTINAELLRHGLIDELFVTLGATLVGGRDSLTILEGAEPFTRATVPRPTLLSVIANDETSELYLRYRLSGRMKAEG